MKKLVYLACILLLLAGVSSCGQDGPLSRSSAKKALEREAMFAKDSHVAKLDTGFYEASPEVMNQLARLKAAGVIEYYAEGVKEIVKDRRWVPSYSCFYGMRYQNGGHYSYTDREVSHVFVNVTLTEEGKKYVIEKPTVMRKDYAELLKHNEDYKENLPDYMKATDNTYSKLTGQPVEGAEEVAAEVDEVAESDTMVAAEEVEETVAEEPEAEKPAIDSADRNARYKSMQARVKSETVNVLLGRYKIVKILDVCCTEDMYKSGQGTCTVVYTFTDVTPFGYVLGDEKPDYYQVQSCSFCLYQDTGWTLQSGSDK